MYQGEREIIHLAPAWPIIFSVYLWIWLSLTVTVLAVREQIRRERAAKRDLWILQQKATELNITIDEWDWDKTILRPTIPSSYLSGEM